MYSDRETAELLDARRRFRDRVSSLENDVQRAFWPIESGPGCAPFPAAMYAFATIDYFSSFWDGWNDTRLHNKRERAQRGDHRNQTDRMIAFLKKFLLYPERNSRIAVNIWRHKLMHTAEPRLLKGKDADENRTYGWSIDARSARHWQLVESEADPQHVRIHVGLLNLTDDLKEGIFGPGGYFESLRSDRQVRDRYRRLLKEFEQYTV